MSKLLLLTVLASLTFLYSCDNEDETEPTAPTIKLSSTDLGDGNIVQGMAGDKFTIKATINAPGGFNVLRVNKFVNDVKSGSAVEFPKKSGTTVTDTTFSAIQFDFLAEDGGKTVKYLFEVVDDKNQTASDTITVVTLVENTNIWDAKLLYAPTGNKTSSTFISTNTGKTWSQAQVEGTADPVSKDIDFGYYYGQTDKASLASIANYPSAILNLSAWGTKNATKFAKTSISATDFDAIDKYGASVIEGLINTVNETNIDQNSITGLTVGNILAFKTDGSKSGGAKLGLIKITEVKGTINSGDYIKITVKVIQ